MFKDKILQFIKKEWVVLSFIMILALVLRIFNLAAEPYWGDEALSLDIVKHYAGDLKGMLFYLKEVEVHPPLYYVLLKFWTGWFGYAEEAVKSLSVIFGLGVVYLAYYAGKVFYPRTAFGLFAAFLTAILPMQIEFSQEARPYIIFCFFGIINILALWQFLAIKNNKYLIPFTVSAIIGIYLHYSFIFILVATFSWWLLILVEENRIKHREMIYWLGSVMVIFLGFYYWFSAFLYKMALSGVSLFLSNFAFEGNFRSIPSSRSFDFIETTLNQLLWLSKEADIEPVQILAVTIFKAVFLMLLFGLAAKYGSIQRFGKKESRKIFYFLWLIAVQLVLFLFLPQSFPYVAITEKHIISISVILIFIIGSLFVALEKKQKALLISLFILSVVNFNVIIMADDSQWSSDHRLKIVADYINENYERGDLVIVLYGFGRTDFNHFLKPEISSVAIYPIYPMDWQNDYLASRNTLGFMENEAQSRVDFDISVKDIDLKLNYLVSEYKPRRVWIYTDKSSVHSWFKEKKWRYAIHSLGELFPVSLYVKSD